MPKKRWYTNAQFLVGCFAMLNIVMYLTINKFWIGGSSFLPMIGKFGPNNKFLFAFIVNLGVIGGAILGAVLSKEFHIRLPGKQQIPKAILGGFLIGMGVTLAPGTCTTAFVIGLPMLSVSSFLSVGGILIGAYITYRIVWRR